ncbi:hypothetical protein K435DRAFT_961792 [Dendrothele bispora CBS 962.96]|uniref:Uncharacterized protein n=1 Tax=Dendrothele bispora (strain CBS 962.96) TaxID=1314807 RepID=A0A4S8MR43_DENBC|nr:hypothetical protein K435DRAFT_961792 [Dendrothele bispora CBS 962.96]
MSHSVPDQRPPIHNDSRIGGIDPSILRGADQILELIQQEREHAIVATRELYQSSLAHQAHQIIQLEDSLVLASKDIKKTFEENRNLAVQCQQQAEDLTFVLKTLAEELGMYVEVTFDEKEKVCVRKLVLKDHGWRDFLQTTTVMSMATSSSSSDTRATVTSGSALPVVAAPAAASRSNVRVIDTSSTSGSIDLSMAVAEYPYLWDDQPIQAVLGMKALRHVVLRDQEALVNAREHCARLEAENARLRSQIVDLQVGARAVRVRMGSS